MFFEKGATCLGGTVFLRIGKNRSRCFISPSAASTHRLSATLPCLIPMPYGCARKRSSVSFVAGSVTAIPSRMVSSNMSASARPSRNASAAFVNPSVTISFVSLWQFFTHRSYTEPLVVATVFPGRSARERIEELFRTSSRPVAL
jgi:hypothetical protein